MTERLKEFQSNTVMKNKEHGAIIVEATLSLSIFMFAIYTVLLFHYAYKPLDFSVEIKLK